MLMSYPIRSHVSPPKAPRGPGSTVSGMKQRTLIADRLYYGLDASEVGALQKKMTELLRGLRRLTPPCAMGPPQGVGSPKRWEQALGPIRV